MGYGLYLKPIDRIQAFVHITKCTRDRFFFEANDRASTVPVLLYSRLRATCRLASQSLWSVSAFAEDKDEDEGEYIWQEVACH